MDDFLQTVLATYIVAEIAIMVLSVFVVGYMFYRFVVKEKK